MRRLPLLALLMIGAMAVAPAIGQTPVRGTLEYLNGLNALAGGRFDQAAKSFDEAIRADDENAAYHTARGISLFLMEQHQQATAAMDRANRLGPTPATELWTWAVSYADMFATTEQNPDPLARQAALPRQRRGMINTRPPYESREPYARSFIDAVIAYTTAQNVPARQAALLKVREFAITYAWRELSSPKYAGTSMQQVKQLFDQKKWAECFALIERIRPQNANDPALLYYSAACRLELGDVGAARDEFTLVLKQKPQDLQSLLGRARAAARMSSMERAHLDLKTAESIDPRATETYRRTIADQLAQGAAALPSEPLPQLLAALKSAATAGEPDSALLAQATRLMRASLASRTMRGEIYTDELQRFDSAATADPRNADKLAALGEFLVNPTAVRPVRIPGKTGTTRIPLGEADLPRGEQALNAALNINPNHINALTYKALAAVMRKQPNEAIAYVKRALDARGMNLDLVRIHVEYYTNQANAKTAEANSLRQPKISFETRGNTEYRVTTYPSSADLARADQLDREAAQLRQLAATPLRQFVGVAGDTVSGYLAQAELARWEGRYDDVLKALDASLKLDPWDLDTHEFYVDFCPKVNRMEMAIEHQDLLNNLVNPSAGRTLDKVWEQLKQTRYRTARETIDQAETIDPASAYVPAYRAAVARADKQTAELTVAVRQALAMEEAKLRVGGRPIEASAAGMLRSDEVGLSVSLRHLWGLDLAMQNKPAEAAEQLGRVVLLARRVPAEQWDSAVQATALPAEENAKERGSTLRELVMDSQFNASKALLAANKPEEAARALMAYVSTQPRQDLPPQTLDMGYPIYQKIGPERAPQFFPPNLIQHFQMLDHQAENKRILERGDEIQQRHEARIEAIMTRQQAIEQQIREAQQARDTQRVRDLQQQRQAIFREYQDAMQQMSREQTQNQDPNSNRYQR